eukprot:4793983-Alexandrium_andersonii.AAC.1
MPPGLKSRTHTRTRTTHTSASTRVLIGLREQLGHQVVAGIVIVADVEGGIARQRQCRRRRRALSLIHISEPTRLALI